MRAPDIAAAAGIAVPILALAAFAIAANAGHPTHPSWVPWVAVPAWLIGVLSLLRRRGLVRILGLLLSAVATALGLVLALSIAAPPLDGRLVPGEPLPEVAALWSDGTSFTTADLAGEGPTVMVFFRGVW